MKNRTVDQPVARTEHALPEDLQRHVDAVRKAAYAVSSAETEYVCCLATLAQVAAHRRLSSGSAADACAHALGITRQTLQPYSLLLTRWEPEELRALLSRRNVHGRPLSLSHLLELARLPAAMRARWIERTLAEGLDAHALRAAIRRGEGPSSGAAADRGAECVGASVIRVPTRMSG